MIEVEVNLPPLAARFAHQFEQFRPGMTHG